MTLRHTYHETRLPFHGDPVELMTRLARGGPSPYAVYENAGEWAFASGSQACFHLPAGETNLGVVEDWLAAVPVAGWRAYGWAAFELGAALSGIAVENEGNLLFLNIPENEVRATVNSVLIRSVSAEKLADLVRQVRAAPGPDRLAEPAERIAVPLADRGNYRAAVAAALLRLRGKGPLEKVILSRRVPVPTPVDLIATYAAGRRANTPARSFLLDLGGVQAAGFSPETVVEVTNGGRVTTTPLAGTRARTGTKTRDRELRAQLLSDPKEIYEHAISVKLAVEDVVAVCDDTHVTEYLTVQDRGTVQHLASTVTGCLTPGNTAWQAFAALFPAVTATGIPKAPAYTLIRELEAQPRGLYAGAVLTYDADATLDAALVLRTVFKTPHGCWLQAGAGIVRQSHPEREHEETCEKLRSVAQHLVPEQSDAVNPVTPDDLCASPRTAEPATSRRPLQSPPVGAMEH